MIDAQTGHILGAFGVLLLVITILFFNNIVINRGSTKNQVTTVVKQFYQYEQSGNFGSSWKLFHQDIYAAKEDGDWHILWSFDD